MSDYTRRSSYWQGKDSLSDSDPEKIISGDDFDDEFELIETAVNTKADLNGDAGESFSAITASAGTNTTQVATTEFVTTAVAAVDLSAVYPVGAVFLTVTNYADSAAVVAAIGGTTWVRFGEGRMMVGYSTTDSDFGTVEGTGGAKTHTLTVDEIPSHTHNLDPTRYTDSAGGGSNPSLQGDSDNAGTEWSTTATGGGSAHNNLPPYIVTYMWKRTA